MKKTLFYEVLYKGQAEGNRIIKNDKIKHVYTHVCR